MANFHRARFEEHAAANKTCRCWRANGETHAHIIGWEKKDFPSSDPYWEKKSNPVFSKEDALENLLGGMKKGYVTRSDARRITEEILASNILPLEIEGEHDLGEAMATVMLGLIH